MDCGNMREYSMRPKDSELWVQQGGREQLTAERGKEAAGKWREGG